MTKVVLSLVVGDEIDKTDFTSNEGERGPTKEYVNDAEKGTEPSGRLSQKI